MQYLLDNELKDKNNVVIWQEVKLISVSRHKSNGFRSLPVLEWLAILKQLENGLRALVHCRQDRLPNIFEELKKQSTTALHVEKDFVSSRKQNDQEFMKHFRALHQSPELELKHLHLLLRNDCDPQNICPKRLCKRARKALKNASSVAMEN